MDAGASNRRQPADPSWRALLVGHWPQYAAVALAAVLLNVFDGLEPVQRSMYSKSDAEYWQYSYPMRPNTIPTWAVPWVAMGLPLALFLLSHLLGRLSRLEVHHACLMLVACVTVTGMLSNLLKGQVGRYRPDFLARCWPDSAAPAFFPDGTPNCDPGAAPAAVKTGMRSFPSVHAAWCGSGLGFLSLWLLGKLRCFCGGAHPAQLLLGLSPLLVAALVMLTRVQDNRHHMNDVLTSLLLGLGIALAFFRATYCSPLSSRAGRLLEDVHEEASSLSPAGPEHVPASESQQRLLGA